ncbi:M23 family metallopeptidase [Roseococcus sp. DSY-14]|uniref:M23 family metallopeptidase n=1 Tax=Roseococcus sp. DSY-14 TaxID=3369650 RepID=UPI00387ACD94
MTPRRALLAAPALLAPALLAPRPARAQVALRGTPAQGALLVGSGAAGRRVALDGAPVAVSPEGAFAIGFGRDHGPRAVLSVDGHPTEIAVAPRAWDVQRITGLPPEQVTPDAATLQRIAREREALARARAAETPRGDFARPFAWPAQGRISGVYGSQRVLNGQPRQPHYGLDVAGPVGTPVLAAQSGRVALAAEFHFFGRLLVLDHGHRVHTLYAHLSELEAREGEEVAQGARIARMGATGRVTGPHLHFSLGLGPLWLDPRPLLPG